MNHKSEASQSDTVLVTGGAGFIGSHTADELLNLGYEVVVLDDLSGGFKDNVPEAASFIEGDVTDSDLIAELFEQHNFDYVFHLAAYAAEGLSHFIKRFNYKNNLIGSVNLINQSIKNDIDCLVFTSSIAVYGENQLPMKEDMTPEPEDPYGIAKYAVETELETSRDMFGLDYIIFRPHNVYGERQNIGDKYRNVVGIFMNKVMQGDPMTIFGDGEQKRAFTHISDVAPVIAESVENDDAYNEIFNVGADTPYTVNYLAEVVADAMGVEPKIEYAEARNEVEEAYADHTKMEEVFNFSADTSLEEGVAKMAEWAKEVGARESGEFENIEIQQNLPSAWE